MKAEQIHKMTLKIVMGEESCHFEFAQLYITVILFSVWDKLLDPGANWSKLERM